MLDADGAAAVEDLRAELSRAKEQARKSEAAASKATEELKAEKAAHCESQEKMAKMAVELKDTADCCQFLEEENRAKATDLEKATMATKDTRSAMAIAKAWMRSPRSSTVTLAQPKALEWASSVPTARTKPSLTTRGAHF